MGLSLWTEDEAGPFQERELRNRNPKFNKENRPKLHYEIYINPNEQDENGYHPVSLKRSDEFSVEVIPKDSAGNDDCWRWGKDTFKENNRQTPPGVAGKKKKTGEGWLIIEKYRGKKTKVKSIWQKFQEQTNKDKIISEIFHEIIQSRSTFILNEKLKRKAGY